MIHGFIRCCVVLLNVFSEYIYTNIPFCILKRN